MENPGILNQRGWSLVRKAQVIGASVGALITIGLPLILAAYAAYDGDGGWFSMLLLWSCAIVLWPASEISDLYGWTWEIPIGQAPSLLQMSLAILTNTLLLFLTGTLSGWIVSKFKDPPKKV